MKRDPFLGRRKRQAVLEPSRLSEPLLDVEKANEERQSKGPARSALERRAAERPKVKSVENLQSKNLKAILVIFVWDDFWG